LAQHPGGLFTEQEPWEKEKKRKEYKRQDLVINEKREDWGKELGLEQRKERDKKKLRSLGEKEKGERRKEKEIKKIAVKPK
jgi:hypothetical protein